jgi:WD40 repeat protein
VALSPDGALLASAGQDRSWKLWDVQSGENLLAVLMQNSWGDCTCLTRSGTRMIVNFRSSIQPAEPIWIPNRSHVEVSNPLF